MKENSLNKWEQIQQIENEQNVHKCELFLRTRKCFVQTQAKNRNCSCYSECRKASELET